MTTIEGKFGIKATVLCDSISRDGVRLTTFELEYPRIVHSEMMTHRMFSRNAASSRAIPAAKMREQLTARPVRFGKNVSGMQDLGEDFDAQVDIGAALGLSHPFTVSPELAWKSAGDSAVAFSAAFADAGYHKQVFNRLTEAFQMIKVVCTATEWNNFFWLRNDDAADPTIHELARCMHEAYDSSTPTLLQVDEWHLPYVYRRRDIDNPKPKITGTFNDGTMEYYLDEGMTEQISLEQAVKVSAARCAAVSFRNVEYGIEKSEQVHARLVGDERKHSSAMEHQATPMPDLYPVIYFNGRGDVEIKGEIIDGTSHISLEDGSVWSGNLRGWAQYRKTIPGENIAG